MSHFIEEMPQPSAKIIQNSNNDPLQKQSSRQYSQSSLSTYLKQLFKSLSIHETSLDSQSTFYSSLKIKITTQLPVQINCLITQFTHLTNIQIQQNPHRIHIVLIPSINHIPINILSSLHRNILNMYLLKLNSKLKFGSISIHPLSGYLKFRVSTLLGDQFTSKLKILQEKNNIIKTIKQLILHAKTIFQHHLPKILHFVNFQKISYSQKYRSNIIHPKFIQQLQTLEKLSSITHAQFAYAVKFKFAMKSNTRKQLNPQIVKLIQKYQKTKIQIQLKEMEQSKIADLNSIVIQKIENGTKKITECQITRKIDERSIKIIRKIASGGSSDVYLIQGQIIDQKIKTNSQLFIKKTAKSLSAIKRLQHQKKISKLFIFQIGKIEPIIPQYFQVTQNDSSKQKTSQLYLQFFPFGTLESFLFKREHFLNILTKIHYVMKLIKTLQQFNFRKVQHMDLKPQNIIVDKKWDVRLIDFGQSYYEQIVKEDENFKVGISMPFSAPQLFEKLTSSKICRCDVFSLGVIMFEIFFGFLPFDYERGEILKNQMRDGSYFQKIHFCMQKISRGIQQRICFLLLKLCMKCMSTSGKLRPTLDWINLYLVKISLLFQNY